jgi:opacity protein-like surface antigen
MPPPPPVRTWTGPFLGVHAGYGWGDSDLKNENNNGPTEDGEDLSGNPDLAGVPFYLDECREDGGSCDGLGLEDQGGFWERPGGPYLDTGVDTSGLFGGLQVGYAFQFDGFVVGARADASVSAVNGEEPFDWAEPDDENDEIVVQEGGPGGSDLTYVVVSPLNVKVDYGWMATGRVMAGILATPDLLLYVNGGVAVADIEVQSVGTQGPWTDVNDSSTEVGYIGGIGGELRLNDEISLFLEGAYADFGSFTVQHKEGERADVTLDSDLYMVNFGINWRPQ